MENIASLKHRIVKKKQTSPTPNGQLLGEEEYKREEDEKRPEINLIMILGGYQETPGRVSEFNIYSSSLSTERMERLTKAGGGEECGAPGDLVNWDEIKWSNHSEAKARLDSHAKVIEVDRELEGPCRREYKNKLFMTNFAWHHQCMTHCQKISTGRSPSLISEEHWRNLKEEVTMITRDHSIWPNMWLSGTEGDKNLKLGTLSNWPDDEIVDNEKEKLEAKENVWRDHYSNARIAKAATSTVQYK